MKYDAKYFIDKFEKIPEDKWCVGNFAVWPVEKHCALGWCGQTDSWSTTIEADALAMLFCNNKLSAEKVNDGRMSTNFELSTRELGDTPKERIINALLMIDSGMLEDV